MTAFTMANPDRRRFLAGTALFTLATGLSLPLSAGATKVADHRDLALADRVSALVIPRTDTPDAAEAGVGVFVLLALAHGLEESRRPLPENADPLLKRHQRPDGSLDQIAWLAAELERRGAGDFLKLDAQRQQALLTDLDSEAYAPGVRNHPWRTIKALILTGYYTSEAGASQELRYDHTPGRWDPDVPLKPEDRAFSSDWTAVEFG